MQDVLDESVMGSLCIRCPGRISVVGEGQEGSLEVTLLEIQPLKLCHVINTLTTARVMCELKIWLLKKLFLKHTGLIS